MIICECLYVAYIICEYLWVTGDYLMSMTDKWAKLNDCECEWIWVNFVNVSVCDYECEWMGERGNEWG